MFIRAGFSALLSLTLGAAIAPTTAFADFGPAFAVSRPIATCFPEVAIDADGDAVFAWQSFDTERRTFRVEARRRGNAGSPRIAMNARGDAVISWCQVDEAGLVRVFGTTFAP
jgi:hypothetical protein